MPVVSGRDVGIGLDVLPVSSGGPAGTGLRHGKRLRAPLVCPPTVMVPSRELALVLAVTA